VITLEQARAAIGRPVIYRAPHGGEPERGTISSVNDSVVFVRYSEGDTAAGTPPERLAFAELLADDVPVTVTSRAIVHRESVHITAAGAPSMRWGDRDMSVSDATLAYEHHQGEAGEPDYWTVGALVFGTTPDGYSRRVRLPSADRDGIEHDWPAWLREWADRLHPARPGGWPGDDPEGSYL
jgi:hypothetical protein